MNSEDNAQKKPPEKIVLYIENAGLSILSPLFQHYFNKLGLLEGDQFKDRASQERAVLLLQYLATGETHANEELLSLNKIICGLDLKDKVPETIDLTEAEKEMSTGLLNLVIQKWTMINNITLQGLQESFITRKGRIENKPNYWRLDVEMKAFDALLDQLPWAFSPISFPWMTYQVNVIWR